MKRKSFEKVAAVALSAAMVCGMAACGSSESSTTGSSAAPSSTATDTSSAAAPSSEAAPAEQSDYHFQRHPDLNAGNNNVGEYADQIFQTIEDYTGVDVELQWVANDALAEKNSLYLASPKTMPQIISWGGTVTGDVVSAAKNGAFVDLNDYIWDSEKYPNLSGMSEAVAANLTVDGKLIAIPRSRVVGR